MIGYVDQFVDRIDFSCKNDVKNANLNFTSDLLRALSWYVLVNIS